MKKAMIVLMIVFLFLLSACHAGLNAGTVIDKQFTPAHNVYTPIIMHINKRTNIIHRWIHRSDHWSVWVQDGEKKDCWDVNKEYFESVEIGDYVERNVK